MSRYGYNDGESDQIAPLVLRAPDEDRRPLLSDTDEVRRRRESPFVIPFQVKSPEDLPGYKHYIEGNEVSLDHFKPPLTHHDFFELTDTWFQGGNGLLFLGYGSLYTVHFFHAASMPLIAMRLFLCGWNYFEVVGRIFIHIYNIIEIARGHRDRKRKLALEVLDIVTTLILGTGTTLSLLANVHVLTGMLATVSAPLASLTAGFCSIVMGFIELVKCYKAYQRSKTDVMLRDRLKRFTRIDEALTGKDTAGKYKDYHKKDLENEREAMFHQSLAIARVAYADGEMTLEELQALIKGMNVSNNLNLNITNVMENPTPKDRNLVNFVRARHSEVVRTHAYNSAFWFLVGTGVSLSAVATFFFPPLLIPAIVVMGLAVVVKAADLLEVDKRTHNRFASKENQKDIEYDNPVTNYLARRQKEKSIRKEYKADAHTKLVMVKEVLQQQGKSLSSENKVKMRIAYELSAHKCAEQKVTETQFYEQLLKQSWWQRRKILNRAMDKFVENRALSGCDFQEGLMQEDKEYYTAKWCRSDYYFFSCAKSKKSVKVDPLAKKAAEAARKGVYRTYH